MIEIIVVAFVLSAIAGLWDLKTTEVPDEIPYLMIAIGIFYWFVNAVHTGDFYPLLVSLGAGTFLLVVGLALYGAGKWGGADAWILAAIMYMIPLYKGNIFLFDYIYNMLIVSIIYLILYTVILGIRNPSIVSHFKSEARKQVKLVIGLPLVTFIIPLFFYFYLGEVSVLFFSYPAIVLFFVLFWIYAKVIENNLFTRQVHSSKVRAGDVLKEMKWIGLTEDQAAKIRKENKMVTIKEGVRYVPVFPITLLVTLLYGNLIFLMI